MENIQSTINLVLKAVAVGMAVAAIVLGFLDVVEIGAQVTLLGIGLFTLSLWALQAGAQVSRPGPKQVSTGERS